MLSTIRARMLAGCVALVVFSLIASAATNYFIVKSYNDETIDRNLKSAASEHADAIGDWIALRTQMIASLADAALSPDPVPALRQVAAAGSFLHVSVGYADKTAKFADATGIPSQFDPTTRPWYRQASQAGRPVVMPYFSMTGKFLVAFAVPVIRDGAVKAVVMGELPMDRVIANVKSIRPTSASFGMLVDGSGRIVAHPDPKLTLEPVSRAASGLGATTPAAIESAPAPVEVRVGRDVKLLRAQAVPHTDWYVLIALDRAQATAGMRSLLTASIAACVVLAGIASLIVGAITAAAFSRLSKVRQAMEAIGHGTGDLTQRLTADGRDEVADIARSFNSFVAKLQAMMSQISDAGDAVRGAAGEIAAGNRDLSSRTESAAASLQQTAASMDEITATVGHSAAATRLADERAASASKIASHGGEVVTEVVTTMGAIEAASGRIGDVIGIIDGIAFQTSILALNAAVEAARAGEQGRGFAVVAQEVRGLAQRSAEAAREVKSLVESTAASVAVGSDQVQQAGETMRDIVTNVANVTTIISDIRHAADEQMRGIEEVNRAVTQLDEMVQQNAALVEQSTAAAFALQTQADQLRATIGQFRIA